MKIVLATHNENKVKELRALFAEENLAFPVEVLSMQDVGLMDDVEENGETFYENAAIKARYGAESGYIAIADDSGLAVDALGGEPGVYSARYASLAGEGNSDEDNNRYLLSRMEGLSELERTASFVTSIVCIFPDGRTITTEGRCEGRILTSPEGDGGFGYDPLFYYPPFKKTFASLTRSEKNSISHRGQAFRKLIALFVETWEKYYAEK